MTLKGSYGDRDPVFALATGNITAGGGSGNALALIRTSGGNPDPAQNAGENALVLLSRIFSRPRKLLEAPGNTLVHGWVVDKTGGKIDEVLVSVYRAPKSYTGEDGADISCHGGIATVKAILAALKAAGFREALPGEFSFRAFMNGKLDLTRCESVLELVNAKTEAGRDHAVGRLSGVLQQKISAVKDILVAVLAETELYLDYDEDEAAPPGSGDSGVPGRPLAEEGLRQLRALADSWRIERLYQEGALAVIAGRPNAGKSSLFNLLVKEDRSIVTDTPGTTRDWIEAVISVEGIPLRLADTAGLRETTQIDGVEQIGIQRSRELIDRADLIIYLVDGAAGLTGEDTVFLREHWHESRHESTPLIALWNKADIAPPPAREAIPVLPVSAKTGAGLAELSRAIAAALIRSAGPGGEEVHPAGLGSLRQKELVDAARAAVEEALALADSGEPLDLIAPLLRDGVNALGEITGEVSTADILEAMFSKFCVGK